MENERAKKRLKDHVKLFNYQLTSEQEEEIIILYNLNNEQYDDSTFSLHIENYVLRESDSQDQTWKEHRRPSVFAKSVNTETFKLPVFKKSKELTEFLMSRLGSEIPFCLLSQEQKQSLVNTMYPLEVEEGVVLIYEGDVGAEMFIIEEGEFEVSAKGVQVNKIGSGAVFGELALLHGIPRTATVTAMKRSVVWSAEQTSFSSIRINDQLYKKNLAKEAISENLYFNKQREDPKWVEKVLSTLSCKFIPAETDYELKEGEIAIILKAAKINEVEDAVKKPRDVNPKDLVLNSFYCLTNLECFIVKMNEYLD